MRLILLGDFLFAKKNQLCLDFGAQIIFDKRTCATAAFELKKPFHNGDIQTNPDYPSGCNLYKPDKRIYFNDINHGGRNENARQICLPGFYCNMIINQCQY